MVLIPVSAPAAEAVTLAQAKAHLRLTHDGEDAPVMELISAACRFLTEDTGVALTSQSFRLCLSDAPTEPVALPRHPVASIAAVTVFDRDGVPNELAGDAYRLDRLRRPARLIFDASAVSADDMAVEIEFVAGFGSTGVEVPDTLKRAVLVLVAHWYEFRGAYDAADQPVSIPSTYTRLTRSWRRMAL